MAPWVFISLSLAVARAPNKFGGSLDGGVNPAYNIWMPAKTHQERKTHIILTSHPHHIYKSPPIHWGAKKPAERGPIIATFTDPDLRNAIGSHSGGYAVYRALAMAAGNLKTEHRPDLTNTSPVVRIGPHPSWTDPEKIVSLDPWGADIVDVFKKELKQGIDIRPSIAITKAHLQMPEINQAIAAGRLKIDGKIIKPNRDVVVTKAALDPVWYLPGIAKRFGVTEQELRKTMYEQTGGMFPELITRPDLKVMLPPIGSTTIYIFGEPSDIGRADKVHTCRVHDECNGSDVFGSDICTCRPYLTHGIEESIRTAQEGGVGFVVYYRKEGRSLGEVTKFLVYNARKRQKGGDSASTYFQRTECVAGVQDMRFQELMPDVLHWLGVKKIDNLVSMSNMKYDAIVGSGIKVGRRIQIPDELVPQDASVEMEAKKAAGYFADIGPVKKGKALKKVKGRALND
jgi:GTP cyclohydrolase II